MSTCLPSRHFGVHSLSWGQCVYNGLRYLQCWWFQVLFFHVAVSFLWLLAWGRGELAHFPPSRSLQPVNTQQQGILLTPAYDALWWTQIGLSRIEDAWGPEPSDIIKWWKAWTNALLNESKLGGEMETDDKMGQLKSWLISSLRVTRGIQFATVLHGSIG